MISWHEALLRLLIALLFSGVVGLERFVAGKAAGVRTHIMVGMGSAMFTLVSGYAFGPTASNADRIAAQVVSGIGFIGGGAILKEGGSVKGLTTAAGLWAVAALGMAAGAGLYVVGGMGTAIILVTLILLRSLERFLPRALTEIWLIEATLTEGATVDELQKVISDHGHRVIVEGVAVEEVTRVTLATEARPTCDIVALLQEMRAAGARSVTCQAREYAGTDRTL